MKILLAKANKLSLYADRFYGEQLMSETLGTKRICLSCNARFYDLGKSPILCPKCGSKFDPEAVQKKRGKPRKTAGAEKNDEVLDDKPKITADMENEDLETLEPFDDDGLLEIEEMEDDGPKEKIRTKKDKILVELEESDDELSETGGLLDEDEK